MTLMSIREGYRRSTVDPAGRPDAPGGVTRHQRGPPGLPGRFVDARGELVAEAGQWQSQEPWVRQQPLEDLAVVHPQVRQARVPICLRLGVQERAHAQLLDEPPQLGGCRRPHREIHEGHRDTSLLEESHRPLGRP